MEVTEVRLVRESIDSSRSREETVLSEGGEVLMLGE